MNIRFSILFLAILLCNLGYGKDSNTLLMDTIQKPFEVKITNVNEVRMGAPYNICNIELVGFSKLNLQKGGWQDKYAWSRNYDKLALIKWDFENNIPSFHLVLIDTKTGQMKESEKKLGLVNTIAFAGNKILINKFLFDKEKSQPRKLCCNIDDEYEFK